MEAMEAMETGAGFTESLCGACRPPHDRVYIGIRIATILLTLGSLISDTIVTITYNGLFAPLMLQIAVGGSWALLAIKIGIVYYEAKEGELNYGCLWFLKYLEQFGTLVCKDIIISLFFYLMVVIGETPIEDIQTTLNKVSVVLAAASCVWRYLTEYCFRVYAHLVKEEINCCNCCKNGGNGYVFGMGYMSLIAVCAMMLIWMEIEVVFDILKPTVLPCINGTNGTSATSETTAANLIGYTTVKGTYNGTEFCVPTYVILGDSDINVIAYVGAFWLAFWVLALTTSCCCCCVKNKVWSL